MQSKHQDRLAQVGQEAQARQAPTSLQKARYERYIPLTANRTTILEEAFDLEVPVRLPQMKSLRPGSDATKYCKFHRSIEHNTKDCWALNGKIEELIQAGYLAQFVKRPDHYQEGARPKGHQEEQHKNQEVDKRRLEDRGRQRQQPQRHERPP